MAILQDLGQQVLKRTSSTLTNFARGAAQAGMAEAPGLVYGYGALRGLSSRFRTTSTTGSGSTSTTSSGVSAKESTSANAVNVLMLREMKQMNSGIQNLNRMIAFQTGIMRQTNLFQEENERERQLQNDRLIRALLGMASTTGNRGQTSSSASSGGLLSSIGDVVETALKTALVAGTAGYALKKGATFAASRAARSAGTQLLGRNNQVIRALPSNTVSSPSFLGRSGSALGSTARFLGKRVLPGVGLGFLANDVYGFVNENSPLNARSSTSTSTTSSDYLSKVIGVESGGRSNAQAPTSSAYGLGQFTRGTFESLASQSSKDSLLYGKSFEDYKKSEELQIEALKALTQQNQARLVRAGLPTDDASLYLAHFLGAGVALKVLQSNNDVSLKAVLPQSYFKANPFLENLKTVGGLKAWAARKMKMGGAGGGGGRGPIGSSSAATDPGEIPGVTTSFPRNSATDPGVITPSSGTNIAGPQKTLAVHDAEVKKELQRVKKETVETRRATEAGNVAMTGRKRPTRVIKTPYEEANDKFLRDFGRVTDRVFKREADQLAQKIFGKDYARGMTATQGAAKGVAGRSAGKILGISKTANKIFGEDYGPVFAQLGMDYMEEGLKSVGETIFGQQVGDDARGLTGAILSNYASGNKKTAKEQLIYGLTGIPSGPQSLTMFLGGPNSPFPSLQGAKNPRDLVNRIAMNASQGTQSLLFGGPQGSGQGGGLFGGLFGRGGGSSASGTSAVDTFNAWETYSNETLVQQEAQTGILQNILGTNAQGNNIFGAVGSGIMKSLGAVGSSLLSGIQWLGGTLGNLIGGLFKGLGSIFGGGGGNFFSNLLNMGSNVLDFGKAIFGAGPITDFGASYLTNLGSTALNAVGLAGTASSYAALVPGLSSTVAGSQAAMLASQTAVFGAEGLAATAAAGQVAGGAAASTAATSSTFMSSLSAAAPYIAVAAIAFSLLSKSSTPKLERGIVVIGNNDISQKFDINNIKFDPKKEKYVQTASMLDSLLNVAFTTVKNIQAKTQVTPPMLAIGMRFTAKDNKLMMKLYTPEETIGADPKWKKYYGVVDQSFNASAVAGQIVRDIKDYYSSGASENSLTAISEAAQEVAGRSYQELSSGQFEGLSSLDTTTPVKEQEGALAKLIRQNKLKPQDVEYVDDTSYETLYNPLTGKYERRIIPGQLGFDEQGRAIIDVNANNRLDLEDIERSRILSERDRVESFMAIQNQNTDQQITYNEAQNMIYRNAWVESQTAAYGDMFAG